MFDEGFRAQGSVVVGDRLFRWGVVDDLGGEESVVLGDLIVVQDTGSKSANEEAMQAAASKIVGVARVSS